MVIAPQDRSTRTIYHVPSSFLFGVDRCRVAGAMENDMNDGDFARSLAELDRELEERGQRLLRSPDQPDQDLMRKVATSLEAFARHGCRVSEDDHRRAWEQAARPRR